MLTKVYKIILIRFLLLTGVMLSCTNTKLEQALSMARENRAELEKVLEHYEKDTNSLKLKAAVRIQGIPFKIIIKSWILY